MEPYDAEFRDEVLAACDTNEERRAIALRFKVSESWLRRIQQQRRETGQVAPKTAAPRVVVQLFRFVLDGVQLTHHREHLGGVAAIGLLRLEELAARMRPASNPDHLARVINPVVFATVSSTAA